MGVLNFHPPKSKGSKVRDKGRLEPASRVTVHCGSALPCPGPTRFLLLRLPVGTEGSQELLPSKVQPFWLEAEEEKEEEFIRIHGYCRGTQGAHWGCRQLPSGA